MPSVEKPAEDESTATATKVLFEKVTDSQNVIAGSVRSVQVVPFVEVTAELESLPVATNVLFPKVADFQFLPNGKVLSVQVIPSVEEAAVVFGPVMPPPRATKVLLP